MANNLPIIPFFHRVQLLKSYLRRKTVCPGLPLTAVIATTQRCNMICRMCLRSVRSFDGPDLEFSLYRKIIDEGAPFFRYICLDGPGETTMNPELSRMVRYARGKGIRVVFSTNATLLDNPLVEEILDSGLNQIIFSVNGATPETYAAVHGGADYHHTVANIRRFLARKRARGAPVLVTVQMIRLPETLAEVDAFHGLWRKEPGVDFVRVKPDVVRIPGACLPRPARSPWRNPCPRLWHGPVFVDTNGDVSASPGVLYKSSPLGNIRELSLAEIWNGERMQAMRATHVRHDVSAHPECMTCAYPRPRLPLIIAGFLLDPFAVGRLAPLAERLAFWHRLPLYESSENNF